MVIMINYYNGTKENLLILSADYLRVIKWYVDAIFVVHPDFNICTGVIMIMVKGEMRSVSRKHKLRAMSIIEA